MVLTAPTSNPTPSGFMKIIKYADINVLEVKVEPPRGESLHE